LIENGANIEAAVSERAAETECLPISDIKWGPIPKLQSQEELQSVCQYLVVKMVVDTEAAVSGSAAEGLPISDRKWETIPKLQSRKRCRGSANI
jgi:hypothetical protein